MPIKPLLHLASYAFLASSAHALESIDKAQYGFSREGAISHQQCADAMRKSQSVNMGYETITLTNGKNLDIWQVEAEDTGVTLRVAHLPKNGKVVLVETFNVMGNMTSQVQMAEAEYVINELCLGFLKMAN